jgi:type I restriction enzyme M protein
MQLDKLAHELFEKEQRLPFAIDPSTGSGTFLIELMKTITKEFKKLDHDDMTMAEKSTFDRLFPASKPNSWAEQYLY